MSGFMIAGTNSGAGKTTISIGIMAALKRRGLCVQPYKVGPDYIDPSFHRFVTDRPSYNLDGFMLTEDTNRYIYGKVQDCDIKIIEGVMGLYDGYGTIDPIGSSAHMAKALNVPVILVVDGSGVSTSAAATVMGFMQMDPDVTIGGVILNKVSGEVHYQILKNAIEHYTTIPCVGYLPKCKDVALSSRHLGLVPAEEVTELREQVMSLAELCAAHIDLDALMILGAQSAEKVPTRHAVDDFIKANRHRYQGMRIGIMESNAFTFYYASNLDLLRDLGCELITVNPLEDEALPRLDALYIGGGFPEVFAEELSANQGFRQNLRAELERGLPCYAECGGLMYLTKSIKTLDGETYPMVGYLDADAEMTKRLQRFGYVHVACQGLDIKCHEFHRSKLIHEQVTYHYQVQRYRDGELIREYTCGAVKGNTLAGYPHVHFLSQPDFINNVLLGDKE